MDFYEVLDQVIDLLRSRGRVTYRALKLQFKLDDECLAALKEEIIDAQQLAIEEDGRILIWIGKAETKLEDIFTQPAQQTVTQDGQPPPPESPTPDTERRQLTVMFSDLVDSTKLSSQLDPEDYREVVRAYQATCAAVIHRYDGSIAQYLGDALLVYFGYPQAHEDDAQRAIHVGLGMLEAMKTLNGRLEQDKGIRLAMRVGIHTGLTVIGDVGSGPKHELLAMGEAPNIAARIQGVAEPDTVAISEATSRLTQGYFTCRDLGAHRLKGVAEPQRVYRVIRKSGAQSRFDVASARGLTPLVGREQEVGLLLERWARVKDGQGHVILLSGEGGIGKSRLVQVLKDHVADEPHTRWECRSSPYYQSTALYPLTDLFQRTLQWQPEDAADAKLAKLEQTLSQYRLDVQEAVSLFAPLLSLPLPESRYAPLAFSPQRQRQKTLETIVAILLEQAEQQPVLFILEDVHWTDPSTLEFLELLIDQIPTAASCVLLTARPTFQPNWRHRSYLTEVTLNRLSLGQIEQMVAKITGGKTFPAEIMQQLAGRTDGVPLYIEEMVKAVLESGLLQESAGGYELTGTFPALAIPSTLHDSLMARLDRLMTAKVIAQLGATIGRHFSYALLQVVSHVDEATLHKELSRLVEAEVLYQRGLPPQATYTFKHALIQDAASQSLLKSTRHQYHQRIALTLEAQFPETAETQPELLAYHYTEAGLNELAIGYWRRAGQHARERSAYTEAISHLMKGLELLHTLPHTPERAQQELGMQIPLVNMYMATKGWGASDVEHVYRRARKLCQQVGDMSQLFPVLYGLCANAFLQLKLQRAREIGEEFLGMTQGQDDPAPILVAHRVLGTTLHIRGELTLARTHLEQAIALYDSHQHRSLALRYGQDPGVAGLSFLAWTLEQLGYPDQARQRRSEALSLARELSHPFSLAYALTHRLAVLWTLVNRLYEDLSTFQEEVEELFALSADHGFANMLAHATMCQGRVLVMQGQMQAGMVQMRQAMATRPTGALMNRALDLALLAEAHGRIKQTDMGIALVEEALALVEGRYLNAAELYRLKGELLLAESSDHQAAAERCFHQALDVARCQQAKCLELRAAMSLARLWQSQGNRQEAYDLLSPVYEWFTEGFDTADLIEAKALLNKLSEGQA